MLRNKNKLASTISILCLLLFVGLATALLSDSQIDFYDQVRQNIKIFGKIYKHTANSYVEEIDPEKFMRAGINGMLDELDPYSVYLEQEAQDEIELMTKGKYFGVGMRISLRNGWPTVAEQPFLNSPAEKAGIREGDQIIEIDSQTTDGLSLSKTAARLRGQKKGSTVEIKIRRVGFEEPISFSLVRDEIVVSDIQFSGFVEPGIGLVKLNFFNRGAEQQVTNAIEDLLNKGMFSLILDLRGNPGGLLDVAVAVANNFVQKGEMVVYTQGRQTQSTKEYRTTKNPIFGNMPLVVLVNEYSASASEIVAGAIQDLDRGIIVGKPTFGKGLVQTVLPIDRTSQGEVSLKLTTAKYYLPSGRLIQKSDVFKKGNDSVFYDNEQENEKQKEDDKKEFLTKNGRKVNGNGGITPDIESDNPNTTQLVSELIRKSMFFNFSLQYAAQHENLTKEFEVSEEMLQEFFAFTKEKEFDYKPTGLDRIEELEDIAKKEDFYKDMESSLKQIKEKFSLVKDKEKQKSIEDIKYLIKRELAAKLFGNDVSYAVSFKKDLTLQKAVEVLKNKEEYNTILGVQTAKSN